VKNWGLDQRKCKSNNNAINKSKNNSNKTHIIGSLFYVIQFNSNPIFISLNIEDIKQAIHNAKICYVYNIKISVTNNG